MRDWRELAAMIACMYACGGLMTVGMWLAALTISFMRNWWTNG